MSDRILLVPNSQRDLAASLGARLNLDGDWIVDAGANLEPFAPWISSHRASSFGVLVAKAWCAHCSQPTKVVGLMLPRGYEEVRRQVDGTPAWARNPRGKLIPRRLSFIDSNALARLHAFNPKFSLVSDSEWGEVFANHCEHCGVVKHENLVSGERDAVIEPALIDSEAVTVQYFNQPLYVHAEDGIEVPAPQQECVS
jgi:hypothetical protein